MSSVETLERKRAEWRRQGLCYSCGEPAAEGHKLCESHLEYHRTYKRDQRAARKAAGQCIDCGAEAKTGVLCPRCKAAADLRIEAKRHRRGRKRVTLLMTREHVISRRAAAGLCASWLCPELAEVGAELCASHADPAYVPARLREARRRWNERARELGRCYVCGWPSDRPGFTCTECVEAKRQYIRERTEAREEAGRCIRCDKVIRARGQRRCSVCRRHQLRLDRARRSKRDQSGICRSCTSPVVDGLTLCERHRQMAVDGAARLRRRQAGIVLKEKTNGTERRATRAA